MGFSMQLFERFFGNEGQPESSIQLNPNLLSSLERVAYQEQKPIEELIEELLYFALEEHMAATEKLTLWRDLTPREQEAAALACLGFTNAEIAEKMVISINTVKAHIRSVLNKFNINSKADLRADLATWDFNGWLEAQNILPSDTLASTTTDLPE
jgi:DNA-binding NarL/FixJ family response regulator